MRHTRYANETAYERNQQYNSITRWLHSFRYKSMLRNLELLQRMTDERPLRIVEIGCAMARLYEVLDARAPIEYTGVEINPEFCALARERYGPRANFRVLNRSAADPALWSELGQPHMVCALETLEHIPEHDVVRIVENIAALSPRLFVASVPIEVGPAIWIKNGGSWLMRYGRAKNRPWREVFWAGLYQLDRVPPHGTGHAGFDWRWLSHTIRHNMQIVKQRRSPGALVPEPFSFSVMFVATPRPGSPRGSNPPALARKPEPARERAGTVPGELLEV